MDSASGKVSGYIDALTSIEGKKGIFAILLTAMVLTIFEMGLFFGVIVPSVNSEMNHNIKAVAKNVATSINEKNSEYQKKNPLIDVAVAQTANVVFSDVSRGVVKTLENREKLLVDDINNYTIYTGVIVILIILLLLFALWNSIRSDPNIKIGSANHGENTDMTHPILTGLMTVGVLIGFQIFFYFFGKKYKYPGSKGKDELAWEIISSIETSPEVRDLAEKENAKKSNNK